MINSIKIMTAVFLIPALIFASSAENRLSRLMREKKFTLAKKQAYKQLLEKPSDVGLLLTIGICAINQRNYDEAIVKLSRAHVLDKKIVLPVYLMGVIYEEMGEFYEAEKYFVKALANAKGREQKKKIRKHMDRISEEIEAGRER